jgi:hypothetical protein
MAEWTGVDDSCVVVCVTFLTKMQDDPHFYHWFLTLGRVGGGYFNAMGLNAMADIPPDW